MFSILKLVKSNSKQLNLLNRVGYKELLTQRFHSWYDISNSGASTKVVCKDSTYLLNF